MVTAEECITEPKNNGNNDVNAIIFAPNRLNGGALSAPAL